MYKSILRIQELKKDLKRKPRVALQMPDGFMIFSILISDILESFGECECVILGDITYGACCIDDLGSKSLECDFIIHYGHSCLVPITETCVKTMYVFVDIEIDLDHLVKTIEFNFPDKSQNIHIMGSIQYNNSVFLAKKELVEKGYVNLSIPQAKPRSSGEVLGCTSPNLQIKNSMDSQSSPVVIFICDGRFHMESAMIANAHLTFYQYNPFLKVLTLEKYDVELMKSIRLKMINSCRSAKTIGIIFGILGRQGNPDILSNIKKILENKNINYSIILLSEITDHKLMQYSECECFVQIACPRISIDWGSYFTKPVITPYEAFVVWGDVEWRDQYPMDFYSYEGGEWSNYYNKKPKNYKK
jgi:2-(3-amino-3-carboxypropyl)histidine synthase